MNGYARILKTVPRLLSTTTPLVALAAFGLAGAAHAQAAGSGSAEAANSSSADTNSSADIVVTALKRGANLQDVPASVSAVSGQALAQRGLVDTRDLAAVIPNLVWGEHFGTTMVVIRGVGSTIDSGITEPTVALYADGVYLPRATMAALRGMDLERVEVIRGPNGTLYGRNATGGAINFISKAPSTTWQAGVTGMFGGRNDRGVEGYVTGPLAPNLSFRISGGFEKQDGYVLVRPGPGQPISQRLNGVDVHYVRGALRYQPSADLTIDLSSRYEGSSAPHTFQQTLSPNPFLPVSQQTFEPNRMYANRPFSDSVKTSVSALTINAAIGDHLDLKSVTSYVWHDVDAASDAEGTALDLFHTDTFPRKSESFGQELTLSGQGEKFRWLVGAFFFHEKSQINLPTKLGVTGGALFGLPAYTVLGQGVNGINNSVAGFIDATYDFTDKFRLNLGMRVNYDDQKLTQLSYLVLGLSPTPLFNNTFTYNVKKTTALPKIALQYDFSDRVKSYLQWSRGYKSGGANLPGSGGEFFGNAKGLYKPESIDAYEIGLKSQLFDKTLTANFAAFYYKYSNLQISLVVPPAATQVNNADARVYGVEGELTWRPDRNITLNAAATYTHARFKNFGGVDDASDPDGPFGPLPSPFLNLDGQPIPRAPKFTFNVSADYRIPVNSPLLTTVVLNGAVRYSDGLVLRYFGRAGDSQKAYAQVELSSTFINDPNQIEVTAFVKNLTNELYKQNVAVITGAYVGNYSPPRTWGVRITKRF